MIMAVRLAALVGCASVLLSACASAPGPGARDSRVPLAPSVGPPTVPVDPPGSATAYACTVLVSVAPDGTTPSVPPCPPSGSAAVPSLPPLRPSSVPVPRPEPSRPRGHFPYAWADADDNPIVIGATFTLVHGVSPAQALTILVPHPKTAIASPARVQAWVESRSSADQSGHFPQAIVAGRRHGWTMILEDNGYRATDRATLSRLSRNGAAVVIYNNVNFDTSFQYSVGGRIRRDFDPMLYSNNLRSGTPLPQERGIGFGHGDGARFVSQSLQLAARLVGFPIAQADLTPARYTLAVGAVF